MEENKFEKQVQQKMDELQIQPSDAVWKKIELKIEKKKSRKWGLIILFLCVGILLPGGYWLWNARQQKNLANTISEKSMLGKNSNSSSTIKENKIIQQKINPAFESTNKKNNDVAKDKEKGKTKQHTVLNISKSNQSFNFDDKSAIAFSGKKEIKNKTDEKTEMEVVPVEALQNQVVNENAIKDSLNTGDKKIDVDTLSKPDVSDKITQHKDTAAQQQTIVETVKRSNKNKWKFGLLFVSGISGAGKDFFTFGNPAVSYSPGAMNVGGQQQSAGFSSSITKAGFGFMAGISAEKNISKKVTFISGINFKSFSTSFKLYDSAGTYMARNAVNKYANHFNFIEVPFSLKIQVGRGKNLPLSWQAGVSISELTGSNALQLNSSTGYYYKDNSLFNKPQVGFNTIFLLTLFSKQKNSVLIGPYFYYVASKIANEGLYTKRHFAFTGLHTSIIFGR